MRPRSRRCGGGRHPSRVEDVDDRARMRNPDDRAAEGVGAQLVEAHDADRETRLLGEQARGRCRESHVALRVVEVDPVDDDAGLPGDPALLRKRRREEDRPGLLEPRHDRPDVGRDGAAQERVDLQAEAHRRGLEHEIDAAIPLVRGGERREVAGVGAQDAHVGPVTGAGVDGGRRDDLGREAVCGEGGGRVESPVRSSAITATPRRVSGSPSMCVDIRGVARCVGRRWSDGGRTDRTRAGRRRRPVRSRGSRCGTRSSPRGPCG